LAMVGWAVLMGKLPYDGESEANVRAVLASAPSVWQAPQLSPIPFGIPACMSDLLNQCLCHNPQKRLGILELTNALAEIDRSTRLAVPLPIFPSGFVCSSLNLFSAIRCALPLSVADSDINHEIVSGKECALKIISSRPAARDLMTQRRLTFDEAASIFLYSTNLIYKPFTAAIRSLDDSQICLWRDFSHILKSALEKLEATPLMSSFPGEIGSEYLIVYEQLHFDIICSLANNPHLRLVPGIEVLTGLSLKYRTSTSWAIRFIFTALRRLQRTTKTLWHGLGLLINQQISPQAHT
jgi:hypothetical protein